MKVVRKNVEKKECDVINELEKNEIAELSSIFRSWLGSIVDVLCIKYKLDKVDVISYLCKLGFKVEEENVGVEKDRKNKCILPFCNKVLSSCCGIKLNYGLYSQCMNDREKGTEYCKTCNKQGIKNGRGKPTYGNIKERMLNEDWRDKNGKEALRYANVMDKLEITREMAMKSALEWGVIIAEWEFEKKEVKRGRPKKTVAVSDTDSEVSVEPKKRGRPRKDKTVVSELSPGDDLIAGLIKEAKEKDKISGYAGPKEFAAQTSDHATTSLPASLRKNVGDLNFGSRADWEDHPNFIDMSVDQDKDKEEEDEEYEEEELEVEKWKHPKTGVEYYITEDNIVYSMESEPVGRWNPDTGEIENVLDLED